MMQQEETKKPRFVRCHECKKDTVDLNDMFVAASRPVLQPDLQGQSQVVGMVQIYYHVECYYKNHPMQYGAEA